MVYELTPARAVSRARFSVAESHAEIKRIGRALVRATTERARLDLRSRLQRAKEDLRLAEVALAEALQIQWEDSHEQRAA
jgi:hypothetical protein